MQALLSGRGGALTRLGGRKVSGPMTVVLIVLLILRFVLGLAIVGGLAATAAFVFRWELFEALLSFGATVAIWAVWRIVLSAIGRLMTGEWQ